MKIDALHDIFDRHESEWQAIREINKKTTAATTSMGHKRFGSYENPAYFVQKNEEAKALRN